jgi:hypothetical protein
VPGRRYQCHHDPAILSSLQAKTGADGTIAITQGATDAH